MLVTVLFGMLLRCSAVLHKNLKQTSFRSKGFVWKLLPLGSASDKGFGLRFPNSPPKIHYAKRRFPITSKYRYMHGVLNVDEIKN
jgi:hypothetical protein